MIGFCTNGLLFWYVEYCDASTSVGAFWRMDNETKRDHGIYYLAFCVYFFCIYENIDNDCTILDLFWEIMHKPTKRSWTISN